MPKKILLKSWNLSDLVIAPACAMGQKLEQLRKTAQILLQTSERLK